MADVLTDDEGRSWASLTSMGERLSRAVDDALSDAGCSQSDYALLMPLAQAPAAGLRARDLAVLVSWDKSRLSKHVDRMAQRGLVRRERCGSDARGSIIVLTPDGRALAEDVAPLFGETVRREFFDKLSVGDLQVLAGIAAKVLG